MEGEYLVQNDCFSGLNLFGCYWYIHVWPDAYYFTYMMSDANGNVVGAPTHAQLTAMQC